MAQHNSNNEAVGLLEKHLKTFGTDNATWESLIADDIEWELPYAPGIGHLLKIKGKETVLKHLSWFWNSVEGFRYIEPKIDALTDPNTAIARVKAEAFVKPTNMAYRQDYVLFLTAKDGKIVNLTEYFDPTRVIKPLNCPLVELEPWL